MFLMNNPRFKGGHELDMTSAQKNKLSVYEVSLYLYLKGNVEEWLIHKPHAYAWNYHSIITAREAVGEGYNFWDQVRGAHFYYKPM